MAAKIYVEGTIVNEMGSWEIDTTLQSVRAQYEAQSMEPDLIVYVKSIGGDVREGYAIRDYLRSLGKPITTIGTGEVYSIATVVFLAGDKGKRKLMPNAQLMIHNPWTFAGGDAEDMQRYADMLRAEEASLSEFYAAETGQDVELLREMMAAETFLSAKDAVTMGFADEVMEEVRAFAKWTPKEFSNSNIPKMENQPTKWEKFLAKMQNAFEGTETAPETTPEAPVVDTTEIDALKSELETLKAKVTELTEKPAPELAPEVAEAVAFAAKYSKVMAEFQKFLEDEKTPATKAAPVTKAAAKVEPAAKAEANKPLTAFEALAAKANKFSKL